jgi:hypothetical protein
MDKIVDNIKDPSWWFTAVLVAIIASLFAAYAKDYLGKSLSRISDSYRMRREKQKNTEELLAHNIASDPHLVTVIFCMSVIHFVIFLFLCTVFLLIPLYREFVFPAVEFGGFNSKPLFTIMSLLILGFCIVKTGTKSLSSLRASRKALDIYIDNKTVMSVENEPRT